MNFKKRPGLILIFSALLVTVCRCSIIPGVPTVINFTNGTSANCLKYGEYFSGRGSIFWTVNSYDCTIPCPDGTKVLVNLESEETDKTIANKGKFDLAALQKQYCKKASVQAELTATAIPPLIAIPNSAPPFLTEEITSCDMRARYINLRMVQSPPDLTDKKLVIAINNTEVQCSIPSNNKSVYSCVLPNNMKFPADILVNLDETEVNNFNYDGTNCLNNGLNDKPNNDDSPAVVPTINYNDPNYQP